MKPVASAAVVAAIAAFWTITAIADAGCSVGDIGGIPGSTAAPEEAQSCRLLGRIFCRMSEFRNANARPENAIHQTVDWLQRMSQTGSHLNRINYKPMVEGVAQYVYTQEPTPPWTSYYYGVYTCGANSHVKGDDDQARTLNKWELTAKRCEKQFPGQGDGYTNDPLRECLKKAVQLLTPDNN